MISNLLVARLVACVVRNAEVLVIVGRSFQVIHLIGSNSKVQVKNLLSFPLGQLRLHCLDILISIGSSHLYNRTSHSCIPFIKSLYFLIIYYQQDMSDSYWIRSYLRLLGIDDKYTHIEVTAVAKQAKNIAQLFQLLGELGIPIKDNPISLLIAEVLFQKYHSVIQSTEESLDHELKKNQLIEVNFEHDLEIVGRSHKKDGLNYIPHPKLTKRYVGEDVKSNKEEGEALREIIQKQHDMEKKTHQEIQKFLVTQPITTTSISQQFKDNIKHRQVIIIENQSVRLPLSLAQYLEKWNYNKHGKTAIVCESSSIAYFNRISLLLQWPQSAQIIDFLSYDQLLCMFGKSTELNYTAFILLNVQQRTFEYDTCLAILRDSYLNKKILSKIIFICSEWQSKQLSSYFLANVFKIDTKSPNLRVKYKNVITKYYANFQSQAFSLILKGTLKYIIGILQKDSDCDIVVFMPCDSLMTKIKDQLDKRLSNLQRKFTKNLLILSLTKQCRKQLILQAILPSKYRKIVFATQIYPLNPDIVIDCGLVKQSIQNYGQEERYILVDKISQSQRSGIAKMKHYCLLSQYMNTNLRQSNLQWMKRLPLQNIIMRLKVASNIRFASLPFLQPIKFEIDDIKQAQEILRCIEFVDENNMITAEGRMLTHINLDVRYLKMLLLSSQNECVNEILTILSFMTVQSLLFSSYDQAKQQFPSEESDYKIFINIFKRWKSSHLQQKWASDHQGHKNIWCTSHHLNKKALYRALDIRNTLVVQLEKIGLNINDSECNDSKIRQTILRSLFFDAARFHEISGLTKVYRTIKGNRKIRIASTSSFAFKEPKFIVYMKSTKDRSGRNFCWAEGVIDVSSQELIAFAPLLFFQKKDFELEQEQKWPSE